MLVRTMKAISERYDARRNEILENIRLGKSSASMSGIEYYPKPWAELDIDDPSDLYTISTALSWDGEKHTHESLRKLSDEEMSIQEELSKSFFEKCSPERNVKQDEIRSRLAEAKRRATER